MSIVAAGAGRVAPDKMISSLENKRISINEAEPPRKFRMVGAKVPVTKAKLAGCTSLSRYIPYVVSTCEARPLHQSGHLTGLVSAQARFDEHGRIIS